MVDIPSYEALKNHLLSISDAQARALFALIYAGMAREGEIARGRGASEAPFKAEHVAVFDNKIVLTIHKEKTRKMTKTGKVVRVGKPIREVPIYYNREAWLANIIKDWAKGFAPSQPLFDYSTRWVEHQFKKWFPDIFSSRGGNADGSAHTIHWLRGWRYSHYRKGNVTGKPVESKVASLLGGWVSSSVPERYYDFTTIKDFEAELENK